MPLNSSNRKLNLSKSKDFFNKDIKTNTIVSDDAHGNGLDNSGILSSKKNVDDKKQVDKNIDSIALGMRNLNLKRKSKLNQSSNKEDKKNKIEDNQEGKVGDYNIDVSNEEKKSLDEEKSRADFADSDQENFNLSQNYQVVTDQSFDKSTEKQECLFDKKNNRVERNFYQQRRDQYRQQQEEEYVINTETVMNVTVLREKSLEELLKIAEKYEVQNLSRMLRQDIITAILKQAAIKGEGLYSDGCLEVTADGFGFLRDSKNNYKPSSYDIYISQSQIKRFGFRQGDRIGAYVKPPHRINDKFFSIARFETINDRRFGEVKNKINFDNLTPLYPTEKLKFDKLSNQKESISTRVIDLIAPIGKGQRALIVAPPRAGKTLLLQAIAHAINENHSEAELIVLLIDERPEEVTDMQRSVKGEVVSSTFDEPAKRHVELAEIVIEKARRMVEDGKDVIILLDSITRLARAYNTIAPSSGKVLTGGVDSSALQRPKRFFGSARNIENGGSLTIIATALIETGSKMDDVIFEEFKGTGNAEIVLDRKLADKRLFPAVDILKSGTRKEEIMVEKDELQKMWILRRILIQMAGTNTINSSEALEFLIDKLKRSDDNKDFFTKMNGPKSL